MIHTDDLSNDYAYCEKVQNQRDIIRVPIRSVTLENYVALSPSDYAIFMEWLNEMRRSPDEVNK